MSHREVELLAIGAGPSNLALAVALEELAPDDFARNCLVVERSDTIAWQPGLLLPWATSQISFIKDLVTLRDPCSEFSFVNFLHAAGRLDDFVNLGNLWPYRSEISDYLAWVANSLRKVKVELGRECLAVTPRRDSAGRLVGWTTRFADGSTIASRYVVIAPGREPRIPAPLEKLSADRIVHTIRYTHRLATLPRDLPYRVAVIGGGQSGAEMFRALQEDLPNARISWVLRSLGPSVLQSSTFTNEGYYYSFVDGFYDHQAEGRDQIAREMHGTNYSGVEPDLAHTIYAERYLNRLHGQDRTTLVPMVEVTGAVESADGVTLELTDKTTGEVSQLERDLVFLGTGFSRAMPALVRHLAAELGLDRIAVSREYRLLLDEPTDAACYLQGLNEETHGISDPLLSVLADRTATTVRDIVADQHRSGERMPEKQTGGVR
jgi:L-ornithine N5-oxygenase